MITESLNRAPSLLLDDYHHNIIIPQQKNTAPIVSKIAVEHLKSKKMLSIDDLDMIALSTVFDEQMLLGSPMYFDSDDGSKVDPVTLEEMHNDDNQSIDTIGSSTYHCVVENPFTKLRQLREKYIRGSFQDSNSNRINDVDNWLIYPKPLPKFWKFEKDNRFKEFLPSSSQLDLAGQDYNALNKLGYYYPHSVDEEYILGGRKKNIHYTGEYFNINLYRKAYNKNLIKKGLLKYGTENRYIPKFHEFRDNLLTLVDSIQSVRLNRIAEKRLQYLKNKFELFQFLKQKSEILENKQVPYRDFYNSRKVDRDLLLSGCITQRELSEFIWEKLNQEPNRVVYVDEDNDEIKLCDIFTESSKSCFNECIPIGLKLIDDDFLEWYKDVYLPNYHLIKLPPVLVKRKLKGKHYLYYLLAVTFVEFDNHIEGQYLAELFNRYVVHVLEKSKYQLAQISVDFQFTDENWWLKFAHWLLKYNLVSYNIRWNIKLNRCYSKLFRIGRVNNFQGYIDSIFESLTRAMDSDDIDLQFFLSNVCSMDLVISQNDEYLWKEFPDINLEPKYWSASGDNPTISQYMYSIYRQLAKINRIRFNKFQNSITFRSDCCPSTSTNRTSQFSSEQVIFNEQIESLVCNLLLCNGGLLQSEPMWDAPATIQYLYYLFQIPIIVSPLSSVSSGNSFIQDYHKHALQAEFIDDDVLEGGTDLAKARQARNLTIREQTSYSRNPFMKLFKIGFKISLSSNSILFNSSYTMEPMIEEYSIAASIYLLNAADLCELSRNSVLCSGYEGFYKSHWIGVGTERKGSDPTMSEPLGMVDVWYDREEDTRIRHNVPFLRREYRNETLDQEWTFTTNQFQ